MHTFHRVWPATGSVLVALLLASGGLMYHMVHAQGPSAQSRTHILTCDEAGLCKRGEQRLLFNTQKLFSTFYAQHALRKGCRVSHKLKRSMSLTCPSTVSLPYTRPERVFRLHDEHADAQIGALRVQQSGGTGQGVLVAILDTGVDASHPELQGRVVQTANFTTAGDGDALGHGTHVAGIIAGRGVQDVSGNRALGVAPGASLIVGKVCNDQGFCLEGDIDAGIEWAVAQHARAINLSLGGGMFLGHCDDDSLAQEANWAADNGTVVVAAAGNSAGNGEGVATPACASKAVAVGAVDANDVRASFSEYGAALDVVAPGVAILSPLPCAVAGSCPNAGYGQWSGTSMATPHVTGVVALLLERNPALTPSQIFTLLTGTARDLGSSGFDPFYGYGRIDAAAAADQAGPSNPGSSSSFSFSSAASSRAVSTSSSTSSVQQSSSSASSVRSEGSSSSAARSENDREQHGAPGAEEQQPPACTGQDWFCQDTGACANARQERLCTLVNTHCARPEEARPPSSRSCESHDEGRHMGEDAREDAHERAGDHGEHRGRR